MSQEVCTIRSEWFQVSVSECTLCLHFHCQNVGVDKRFPKGTIYPGVIALYRALTEARHYRRMHRIQSQRLFGHGMNGTSGPSDSASVVSAQDSAQVDQVQTQHRTVMTMTVDLAVMKTMPPEVASQVQSPHDCCYRTLTYR